MLDLLQTSDRLKMYCFVEGLCAYGGQVCLTSALRLVEAAPATAMSYLTVVWGLILGYCVFKEVCFACSAF